jgi:hypothetical protein
MASDSGIRAIVTDRSVTPVVGVAFVLMLGGGIVLPILPLVAGLTTTAFGFETAFAVAAAPAVIALVFALRTGETLRSARASSKTA